MVGMGCQRYGLTAVGTTNARLVEVRNAVDDTSASRYPRCSAIQMCEAPGLLGATRDVDAVDERREAVETDAELHAIPQSG